MFPMAKRSSDESENGEEDCCEGEVVNEDVRKRKIIIRVVYGKGSRTASSGCSSSSSSSSSTLLCCQADECGMDLRMAKKYHQRHKICERHSKAAVVLVSGIRQRFCQQCSKFHEISLFDDTKRSCRERLAGHNERRRKTYGDSDFGTRQRLQINGLNRTPRITIDK